MKRLIAVLLVTFGICGACFQAKAEGFCLNVYGNTGNFWSNSIARIPASYLSTLLNTIINVASDEERQSYIDGRYQVDIFNVKQDGSNIHMQRGRYFGFKARDLFNDIHGGIKFGWSPRLSPFGVYLSFGYQFKQFKAEFHNIGWQKYQIQSIRPGVGIRITPFLGLLEDDKFSPMIEAGTSYVYNVKVKGPYDSAADQFNSGMCSTFSIGARSAYAGLSFQAGVEIYHYDQFNKNFSPDEGLTHPYENVTTGHYTVFIAVAREF